MKRTLNLLLAAGLIVSAAAMASPTVEMQTSAGTIVIELDSEKTPITVKSHQRACLDTKFIRFQM